jgi:hypothetical protein
MATLAGVLTPGAGVAREGGFVAGGGGRARHVIHMFLHGGAATQDMFDLKPTAPPEIRGEFQPIDTNAACSTRH